MVEEKVRRREGFETGRWVRMGDHQHWMFPPPPAPGNDCEYDALIQVHHEAEDADDERRIELAMAILLLSRNYAPTPREYQEIFNFGADESARATAQAAIAEVVQPVLKQPRVNRAPVQQPRSSTPMGHTHFRTVRTSVRSYAGRVCSTVAPWLKQPSSRP
jgi:hypothetical protein